MRLWENKIEREARHGLSALDTLCELESLMLESLVTCGLGAG